MPIDKVAMLVARNINLSDTGVFEKNRTCVDDIIIEGDMVCVLEIEHVRKCKSITGPVDHGVMIRVPPYSKSTIWFCTSNTREALI